MFVWPETTRKEPSGLALEVRRTSGFSFYDSLIVAAAVRGQCSSLLTEDLQEGREIQGVRIDCAAWDRGFRLHPAGEGRSGRSSLLCRLTILT